MQDLPRGSATARWERELRALVAPLQLVAARAVNRPARWLWPAFGLAIAAAFACAVTAEGTIAGDRAARATLAHLSAAQSAVTVTEQGPASPAVARSARALLAAIGLPAPTRVTLLGAVRLGGEVVRPAAIAPLDDWVNAGRRLGRCRPSGCPVVSVGGGLRFRRLTAPGVRLTVAGHGRLRSAAPLGFAPAPGGQPVLVTDDVHGLSSLPALSSVYRTESWLSVPRLSRLDSWQLAALKHRLAQAQSSLPASGGLTLSGPTDVLQLAQAQANAAPQRLLPAGGGALAALAMFVVLAAYGLRQEQRDDRERLRAAGARVTQLTAFSLAEAAWLSAVSLLGGAVIGTAAAAVLAGAAGLPVGAVLTHSLLQWTAVAGLGGGWVTATAVIGAVLLLEASAIADVLALAAVAALALALIVGGAGNGALGLLVAPLACLAAGAIAFRLTAAALRAGERLARRGPLTLRLALVALARAPVAPAVAAAFVTVSLGLGGFALAYRATLQRGTADEADQTVPVDARVIASAQFLRPLQAADLATWRRLAQGGTVLPVRRTDAALALAGNAITVTALGVPATGLPLLRGWRAADGSAPLRVLARRLAPRGPVRSPGPLLPANARRLEVWARAQGGEVQLTAELRDRSGTITAIDLGTVNGRRRLVRGKVPLHGGPYELAAFELGEPTAEATLNGHQNGENPAATTQGTVSVALGAVSAGAETVLSGWQRWLGVGAATVADPGGRTLRVAFDDSGQPGVVRPHQPTDDRAVPVLADPVTAASAGPDRQLPLTVDGEPVAARVVGIVRRFPTLDQGQSVVIADAATLDGALDAALPGQGQGQTDELWIATPHPQRLRAALRRPPLRTLSATFRADVQRSLRADPIARAVQGTLFAAAAITALLALTGLLVSLLGAMRDPRTERDLAILGLGPRQVRRGLSAQVLTAAALGSAGGLLLTAALTRLVVTAVRAAGAVAVPDPPLVVVAPWGELLALTLAAVAVFAVAGHLASLTAGQGRSE